MMSTWSVTPFGVPFDLTIALGVILGLLVFAISLRGQARQDEPASSAPRRADHEGGQQ